MRVLVSAYSCDPGKGSEPGAGWNWALAAARDNEVWVITRQGLDNHRTIEAELKRRPQLSLKVVYVDLPRWARWRKPGQPGLRTYYIMWQVAAWRAASRLQAEVGFDVVHHVTFANAWLPALVGFVDAPLVMGPVDAGLTVPLRFYGELGVRGVAAELRTGGMRMLGRTNPVVRRGLRRSSLILAQNDESAARLRQFAPVVVRPNACVDPTSLREARDGEGRLPRQKTAVVAGRLIPLKGVSLAIRAMALLPEWRLEVIGIGPDRRRLQRLAKRLGVADRIIFIPWLTQDSLWRRMAESSAVVVPSLRDASPLVVAEASALGVPVVALEQGGPRVLARMSPGSVQLVPLSSRRSVPAAIAAALEAVSKIHVQTSEAFSTARVADDLKWVYAKAVSSPSLRENIPDPTRRPRGQVG